MRIWIDLANSPHPPLFGPIADAFERDGSEVVVTVRDSAQTVDLARERWPAATVIGGQTPARPALKARAIAGRALKLRSWAATRGIDVALSHNSYAQIAAARSLGIPAVTAMDYEHQPSNHIAFRLASRILLPEALPPDALAGQGATPRKVRIYPGLKEEITLDGFEPDDGLLDRIGVDRPHGTAVVVTRPPPSRAIYHRHGNDLYVEALRVLGGQPHVRIVVLPRFPEQRGELLALGLANLTVLERAVDARALMYAADLVIGAGGTMTREAAVLGVPTLTAFAGRPAAVDRWLEQKGLLRRLTDPRDVADVAQSSASRPAVADLRARAGRGIAAFVSAVNELRPPLPSASVTPAGRAD
jgi:predicted glycosyltransferase